MSTQYANRFVELTDIAGVRFTCGCGQSIELRTDELTSEKLGTFFANHVHSDTASFATVTEDRTFLNGRLARFLVEDLKKISEIADRRKLKFSLEIPGIGREGEPTL